MPVWALLKPLATLAFLVSIGVAFVNHLAGPWSAQKLRELIVQVRTDLMAQVIQPWRFTSPETKLTVHIRDRAPNGELLGLMMHDGRDPKQVVTYLAERGLIFKQGQAAYLRMDKGHIVRRLADEPTPQIIAFDRYAVDLSQLEQRMDATVWLKPRERYTSDLLRPDPQDPVYKAGPGGFASEAHDRFASPLYTFAFVLLVIAFMGQAQTTRTSRMQAVIGAFAVGVACRLLGIAAASTAVSRPATSWLLYAAPVGTCLLAAVATQWHMYPRRPSSLGLVAATAVDSAWTAAPRLWSRPPARGAAAHSRG